MMVALNNKFKAKFAKLEASKQAAATPADGALQQELDELKAKLVACEKRAADLQELNAGHERANEAGDLKDAEIAELKRAVAERDALLETAKERYQTMGQKARAAVEERNSEIEALTGQLEEVIPAAAPARLRWREKESVQLAAVCGSQCDELNCALRVP